MSNSLEPTALARRAPLAVLVLVVACWLWPLGVGGRMPVGGDVTAFQIGLMAEYRRALHTPRLPVWNDHWGYGFPGLAESQMGVYYPPHVIIYGLLPLEAAYTASLVLHTFWAALGGYWAARRFGASPWAAALASIIWSTCGFFVIHITHQWGYTAASWMPWAWGLAWLLLRGQGTARTALLLAAVLAIQILPGHFQLAFITQVSVCMMMLWSLAERLATRGRAGRWSVPAIILPWLGALFLAIAQLAPTWELAQRAESNRTYEYLSGFAESPVHLVSFVAPGLFHRSPHWRPVAWDPFHTSPEECLAYVGLVPLWLAILAFMRRARVDPAVRTLAVLAIATLVLSLGPYIPGFSWLIRLPGFSFFRAPARWTAAASLALALLAGIGFDYIFTWSRVRTSMFGFAALVLLAPLVCVLAFEAALLASSSNEPAPARAFDSLRRLLPWPAQSEPPFHAIISQARKPASNPITLAALARRGIDQSTRLDQTRGAIYLEELGPTALLLVVMTGWVLANSDKPRRLSAGLFVLAIADLLALGRTRDVDDGPIKSLVEQSPVLQELGRLARETGGRTVDTLGNLPMVAGASPLIAYRTLDIPAATTLGRFNLAASNSVHRMRAVLGNMWRAGANVRVAEPEEPFNVTLSYWPDLDILRLHDPALAKWLGKPPSTSSDAATFRLLLNPVRVWRASLARDGSQRPIHEWQSNSAGSYSINLPADRPDNDTLMLSLLYDPNWQGTWSLGAKREHALLEASREPSTLNWIISRPPAPGAWTLELDYRPRSVYIGLAASAIAWTIWLALWCATRKKLHPAERTPAAPVVS